MAIINRIGEFHQDMTAWRRDLHAHPELGFEEHRTAAIVADRLKAFGVDEVHTGIARTGVVGVLRGRQRQRRDRPARRHGRAADRRGERRCRYASTTAGKMHACGHDGHTTMLLGAARYLAETRNFDGTVYLIFQPAEEMQGGGRVMLEEGLLERFPMSQLYGLHNWPQPAARQLRRAPGPDDGRGRPLHAHAARPGRPRRDARHRARPAGRRRPDRDRPADHRRRATSTR